MLFYYKVVYNQIQGGVKWSFWATNTKSWAGLHEFKVRKISSIMSSISKFLFDAWASRSYSSDRTRGARVMRASGGKGFPCLISFILFPFPGLTPISLHSSAILDVWFMVRAESNQSTEGLADYQFIIFDTKARRETDGLSTSPSIVFSRFDELKISDIRL